MCKEKILNGFIYTLLIVLVILFSILAYLIGIVGVFNMVVLDSSKSMLVISILSYTILMRVIIGLIAKLIGIKTKMRKCDEVFFRRSMRAIVVASIFSVWVYLSLSGINNISNVVGGINLALAIYGSYVVGKECLWEYFNKKISVN